MKNFKKILIFSILIIMTLSICSPLSALTIKNTELNIQAKSAVLMDAKTGTILYSLNKDEKLPPASVTKIMTLLLVFEAIEKGNVTYEETLMVSEYASSMGGSQVFLEPGETMSVDELLKCVIVASANDAAVTLAEHIAGSEEAFVELMNEKAQKLGMKNTHFQNVTGLDDDVTEHLTTAYDIAIMSRELLKHKKVTEYATIWMDTIRNGEFGLTNTNRLVRYYKGITGLKTGSTDKAGFCISATAKRDGMELIAVIMGAESSNIRNASAIKLLDYGFANYTIYHDNGRLIGKLPVICGKRDFVQVGYDDFDALENKGNNGKITQSIILPSKISAPVKAGDVIGEIIYKIDGELIGRKSIYCLESVQKLSFMDYLGRILIKIVKN